MFRTVSKLFAFFALLFLLLACSSTISTSKDTPLIALSSRCQLGERRNQPLNISIDPAYSPYKKYVLKKAFLAWEKASGGRVKFVVEWGRKSRRPLKENPAFNAGIFFWSVKKDSANLSDRQLTDWQNWDGVAVLGPGYNSVNVVIFDHVMGARFYPVALHEIGHVLGLAHEGKKHAVMGEYAQSNCITMIDALQLCKIYGCVPRPDCHL